MLRQNLINYSSHLILSDGLNIFISPPNRDRFIDIKRNFVMPFTRTELYDYMEKDYTTNKLLFTIFTRTRLVNHVDDVDQLLDTIILLRKCRELNVV